MMDDVERIAKGLSGEGRASLLQNCSCGHAQELVDLGLWTPEFPDLPPEYKQEYFDVTPLGLAVRTYLQENDSA